ncbi:MAG: hypothetical protein ACREWI_13790 [Telluria sp.]
MHTRTLIAAAALASFCSAAHGAPPALSPADQAAAFKAAGFKLNGKQWRQCEDPSPGASAGEISEVRDLNGDGMLEAVITEGGTYCYGHTGAGYALVSKQANGSWKLITGGTGMPSFLRTKGKNGWPDIEVGGPGFCFPVERWDGRKYTLNRHEYEGKSCRPNR